MRNTSVTKAAAGGVLALVLAIPAQAGAYEFTRVLQEGATGADVRALQIRVAGWFPRKDQKLLRIDGVFGHRTTRAVKRFQRAYELTVDGVAGDEVYARIDRIESRDGSTSHFDWSEFKQNDNSACSAAANAYAGTFKGGMVAPKLVRRSVRRLMWRLEALRRKSGRNPVGINSGFRSVEYNDCIGGARASQHMYGTAADNRVAEVDNHRARNVARRSQFHGIACYARLSHNHLDLRIHNRWAAESRHWWWPEQDEDGRDLDTDDKPCFGEPSSKSTAASGSGGFAAVAAAEPGAGSAIPNRREIALFARAGEPRDLGGAD